MSTVTKYAVLNNAPGCLPDGEVEHYDTWDAARSVYLQELRDFYDYLWEGDDSESDDLEEINKAIQYVESGYDGDAGPVLFHPNSSHTLHLSKRVLSFDPVAYERIFVLVWYSEDSDEQGYDFWRTAKELNERLRFIGSNLADDIEAITYCTFAVDFENTALYAEDGTLLPYNFPEVYKAIEERAKHALGDNWISLDGELATV